MEDEESIDQLTPRPYQAQLEEIATRNNTIIYLPTGSGKTYIAICLIRRFREALKKPWGQGGKRTFFLVNTVPLVNQQKQVIEKLCAVSGVGAYSGEDGVDYWNKDKWDIEMEKNQIIVMTSQILSDMLTHQYIKIEDINLLIFDECHHAVEDHPMRIIMKHFEDCPKHEQPRVLGLTATLLNANVKTSKVEQTLHELEVTFHATIATVDELGKVLDYSTNPREIVQFYKVDDTSEISKKVIQKLTDLQDLVMNVKLPKLAGNHDIVLKRWQQNISSDPKKVVKAVKNMLVSMINFIIEFGMYGGAIGILAYIVLMERLKRKSTTKEEEQFYQMVITACLHARAMLLHAMSNESGYNKIKKYSSEKFLLFLNILKEYNPTVMDTPGVLLKVNQSRQQLSALIFTTQRFTAKVLFNILKGVREANMEEFGFLRHDFIVGFNVNPMKNTREESYVKKASQQALLKFRNNELNCLISTSVIEEGIDLQQCLLVIRYDPPIEYRSYIQSKGRARSAKSSYVILVNEANQAKYMNNYRDFQFTERLINRILVGSSDEREEPAQDLIESDLYRDEDIPPYVTPNGGRLTSVSAISLLNRYCSILPHDQFTVITPMWIQEIVDERRLITIIMPISCPVKDEIRGMPMLNSKSAKRSAALNACAKLYEAGELDPITMLPLRYTVVDFDNPDVKACFPNWRSDDKGADKDDEDDVPYPGTKKRVRTHRIQFPTVLNSTPENDVYYLHIIKLTAAFQEPKESREKALYNLLQQREGFGFLTQKPLPKLCKFPMYMSIGEVATSIEVNYAYIKLNTAMVDMVKNFHYFLFDQVLSIVKKFLVFEGRHNCMYVVPVKDNDGYDIDWDMMSQNIQIPPVTEPPYKERMDLKVTKDNYMNCVVTPWYRVLSDRYIVSNVLEYMTPKSHLDPNSFTTFEDYYVDKYKLEIFGDKSQALLEVKNISSGMNCLLPRAATINTFTDKQKKLISVSQGDDKPKRGFLEVFVAEFCIKYDFPGVLWYKATMLPSILHRVFMLLMAHELMTEISKGIKSGSPQRSRAEEWLPIQTNIDIATNSLLAAVEEPTPINTVDRINNPIDEDGQKRPKILSMKESLFKLKQTKLNNDFPWDAKMEPIDIERNLSTVTVMDIECYDEFVSAPIAAVASSAPPAPAAPPRPAPPALSAPPATFNDKIALLTKKPSNGPELRDVVAALTTIKSHDNFNLERVETLGDSFLKFAASLYLYHKFPKKNEGQLTNIKGKLISNRNLYYAAERFNLGGRMKVEQFSPRKDFLMPGFFAPNFVEEQLISKQVRPTFLIGIQFPANEVMSGELSAESKRMIQDRFSDYDVEIQPEGYAQNPMQSYLHLQAVSDKSVADCVEALIGTYLLSDGILGAIKLVEWMKVISPQDKFAEYLHKKVPTVLSENKASLKDINFMLCFAQEDVEKILNYKFNDPSFLLEALSHPSYIRNRLTRSYERLEFLGDAILDFLITSHIFENCKLKPGMMTDLRSALVNNVTFASYVVKLGLHKFMCSELNPTLDKAIIMFVDHQEQRDHEIVEDVLYLIDEEECHIAEYVEVPKVLSDIFEALVGAMYLDSGGDLQKVWSVIYGIMHNEIHNFSARIPKQPVRVLYEKIHACPVFGKSNVIDPDIPKIKVPVTITKNGCQHTVFGIGKNKSQAKRAAAKMALKLLSL